MTDFLATIYSLRVFNFAELEEATHATAAALQSALLRWQSRGLVRQLRRNLYCAVDIGTGALLADRYEIASHVSATACVGYHSALEFHGLAHQMFYSVHVKSVSRFNTFRADGLDYRFFHETVGCDGHETPAGNPNVRVSNLERTLADCFDHIDRAGGLEELLHCLEGLVMVDEDRLLGYIALYNKKFLYQKAGFLMARIREQAHISDLFFSVCHDNIGSSVKSISGIRGHFKYVKEWNLYVPEVMTGNTEAYDLI